MIGTGKVRAGVGEAKSRGAYPFLSSVQFSPQSQPILRSQTGIGELRSSRLLRRSPLTPCCSCPVRLASSDVTCLLTTSILFTAKLSKANKLRVAALTKAAQSGTASTTSGTATSLTVTPVQGTHGAHLGRCVGADRTCRRLRAYQPRCRRGARQGGERALVFKWHVLLCRTEGHDDSEVDSQRSVALFPHRVFCAIV